jgi:hypothetical protein
VELGFDGLNGVLFQDAPRNSWITTPCADMLNESPQILLRKVAPAQGGGFFL